GALIIAFSWPTTFAAETLRQPQRGGGQGSEPGVPPADQIDSWLAIDRDGLVTLFRGKGELGTGGQAALAQIVAEELHVQMSMVQVIQGETGRVPNQGPTVGSKTIQVGAVQIRKAAAAAFQALMELAGTHFGGRIPDSIVRVENGVVWFGDKLSV